MGTGRTEKKVNLCQDVLYKRRIKKIKERKKSAIVHFINFSDHEAKKLVPCCMTLSIHQVIGNS